MTFPLPPREAAVLGEFVRLLDARLVTEGAAGTVMPKDATAGDSAYARVAPSVTEPLFPDKEAA